MLLTTFGESETISFASKFHFHIFFFLRRSHLLHSYTLHCFARSRALCRLKPTLDNKIRTCKVTLASNKNTNDKNIPLADGPLCVRNWSLSPNINDINGGEHFRRNLDIGPQRSAPKIHTTILCGMEAPTAYGRYIVPRCTYIYLQYLRLAKARGVHMNYLPLHARCKYQRSFACS